MLSRLSGEAPRHGSESLRQGDMVVLAPTYVANCLNHNFSLVVKSSPVSRAWHTWPYRLLEQFDLAETVLQVSIA
jgi:hypothetical protein